MEAPSGEKSTDDTLALCPLKIFNLRPERFHNIGVLSSPAVRIMSPFGEKSTANTADIAPGKDFK